MKHQYFGDVNDYVKYGILRRLAADGRLAITACWMLTPDEPENREGRKLGYLRDASWRVHDPELFEFLRAAVIDSPDTPRHVSVIERSGMLRGVRPFSRTVPDDVAGRAAFFEALRQAAHSTDFVLFDPDNGFEIASCPRGRRRSSKFLFWDEVEAAYAAGHSILAYQHFARRNRAEHVDALVDAARRRTGAQRIWPLCTAHALFLLISRPEHERVVEEVVRESLAPWSPSRARGTPGRHGAGNSVSPNCGNLAVP